MYKLNRLEASELLNISVRSIDRYIKSGKVRSKKDWKIVLVNQNDIDNLMNWWTQVQEVIMPKKKQKVMIDENEEYSENFDNNNNNDENIEEIKVKIVNRTSSNSLAVLEPIYADLKNEIQKKDMIIQDLSIRIWRSEEIAKNSVSISDFKKSQFLLEESKWFLSKEVEDLRIEKNKLGKELNYEKSTNNILIAFILILLTIAIIIWFAKV